MFLISILFFSLFFSCNKNKDEDPNADTANINSQRIEQGKCTSAKTGQISSDKFTLKFNIKDNSGNPISGVKIKIRPLVMEKKVLPLAGLNPKFYFTKRYQSNDQGILSISDLPVKINADANNPVYLDENIIEANQELDYSIVLYKSGFTPAEEKIGKVSDGEISLNCQLNKQENTSDFKIALLDYQFAYGATDFLIQNKILFSDITGKLNESGTDLSQYKILALGVYSSFYVDYANEFIGFDEQKLALDGKGALKIKKFVEDGGTLFFFPQNDDKFMGFFSVPGMEGFTGIELMLADEDRPNDFNTADIIDKNHILISGEKAEDTLTEADLQDWKYIDTYENREFSHVVFDAIQLYSGWSVIIGAPGTGSSEINPANDISANKFAIAVERDLGKGKIFLCQAAYHQAAYGTLTSDRAKKFSKNIVYYLKTRAGLN